MSNITIEEMTAADVPEVTGVCARAYLTNPLNVAVMGDSLKRNGFMVGLMLQHFPGLTFVAKEDGKIVGMVRTIAWPDCQTPPAKMLRFLSAMLLALGGSLPRIFKWLPIWEKYDPREPHWHFDPYAVLPERQGQGIGTRLMRWFLEHVDQLQAATYLETDRPENVPVYEHFGFKVTAQDTVVGVPNWFMWRAPRAEG